MNKYKYIYIERERERQGVAQRGVKGYSDMRGARKSVKNSRELPRAYVIIIINII